MAKAITEEKVKNNLIALGAVVVFSFLLLTFASVFILSSLHSLEESSANLELKGQQSIRQRIFITKAFVCALSAFVALAMILGTRLTYIYGRRLIHFLFFDELTGADNINRFSRKLSLRLGKTKEQDYLSVATLNIRRFNSINEIFGEESANDLLRIIKAVLEKSIGEDEFFCREAYDVFHVCLSESDEAKITSRIETIFSEVSSKYLESHDYNVRMYAGVIVLNGNSSTSDIFSSLSIARGKAREKTGVTVCFYNENLHISEEVDNYIETHMEQSLIDESFKLYIQPKMDLADEKLYGAEVLVRWEINDGKVIPPSQFIPLFNKNGFCVKLDMHMLEKACKLIREWIDSGIEPIHISINQSRLLFFEANYVDKVVSITAKYSVPPSLITLEVLEEIYCEDIEEINKKIAELRKHGFLISIDDFGSGYSSFSTMGELRVDELKLDRNFLITASGNNGWRMKIVIDQVIRMARRLHLSVVAEGIETKENEKLVKTLGCDFGQGYYYCKPIPANEFNERYMNNRLPRKEDDEDIYLTDLS